MNHSNLIFKFHCSGIYTQKVLKPPAKYRLKNTAHKLKYKTNRINNDYGLHVSSRTDSYLTGLVKKVSVN